MSIFDKIFGTYSDRELKRIRPIADKVMALEDDMAKLSDAELKAKTPEFKERLKNGETLDDLLPEAFAVMREASWRVLGNETLLCTGYRWYYSSSGTYRRNENR